MIAKPEIKEVFCIVTDEAEIASIKADDFHGILGGQLPDGQWVAYKFSRDQWRERQAATNTDRGTHHE